MRRIPATAVLVVIVMGITLLSVGIARAGESTTRYAITFYGGPWDGEKFELNRMDSLGFWQTVRDHFVLAYGCRAGEYGRKVFEGYIYLKATPEQEIDKSGDMSGSMDGEFTMDCESARGQYQFNFPKGTPKSEYTEENLRKLKGQWVASKLGE